MKLVRLKTDIDFDDPEEGFSVKGDLSTLVLQFRDWTNELHSITFTDVERFVMDIYPVGPEDALDWMSTGGSMYEVVDSERIARMRADGDVMPNDEMHHYLVYHNAEEYCEIIASGFEVGRGQRVPPDSGENSN